MKPTARRRRSSTALLVAAGGRSRSSRWLWMLSVSFMAPGEASAFPPPLLPQRRRRSPTTASCSRAPAWAATSLNSLLLASAATLLSLLFNVMAGYAFAKLRFAGRERIFRAAARRRW